MEIIGAFAQVEHIGMDNGAHQQDVLEDKFGMVLNANVKKDLILMEKYASFVLMASNGMKEIKVVIAPLGIFGMVIIVKKELYVQEIEFIIRMLINAYVRMVNFGMEWVVWFSQIVVVEKFGILHLFSVIAHLHSIGMEEIVSSVLMEKFGINLQANVNVEKELNGMANFVLLFKIVMEEWFGIKILGLVNVLVSWSGMEDSVLLIHAKTVKFGIISEENAYAQVDYNISITYAKSLN